MTRLEHFQPFINHLCIFFTNTVTQINIHIHTLHTHITLKQQYIENADTITLFIYMYVRTTLFTIYTLFQTVFLYVLLLYSVQ
jgi:hypothetical protein